MTTDKKEEWFETWFDSPYYHILYHKRDFVEAEKFIDNLVEHLKLPVDSKCLDLACGKGRHSIYLNSIGYNVTGLDLSENSINEAKEVENEGLFFDVHDMREVYKEEKFDVIFNLFTSFGYFEDYEDNVRVLKSVNSMLEEDGVLVIDFMNSYYVLNHLVKSEIQEINGIEFKLSRKYDGRHILKDIVFEDKGKNYHFQEKVQALKLDDFEIMLRNSGFKIIETLGDMYMRDYNKEDSNRLIIIAKKK